MEPLIVLPKKTYFYSQPVARKLLLCQQQRKFTGFCPEQEVVMNAKWIGYALAAILVLASCDLEPSNGGPTEDFTSPSITSITPSDGEDSVSEEAEEMRA